MTDAPYASKFSHLLLLYKLNKEEECLPTWKNNNPWKMVAGAAEASAPHPLIKKNSKSLVWKYFEFEVNNQGLVINVQRNSINCVIELRPKMEACSSVPLMFRKSNHVNVIMYQSVLVILSYPESC